MSHPVPSSGPSTHDAYVATQQSAEFQELRRTHRGFVFPWAVFFLLWYFAYVLLAAFAKDFMATKVAGNVTIGLILGLLQFVTTFMITILYMRWADRTFDPKSDAIRERLAQAAPVTAPEQGIDLPEVLDGVFDDDDRKDLR